MNNANNANKFNIMTEDAIKQKYLRLNNTKLLIAKFATVIMIIAALFLSRAVFESNDKSKPKGRVYDGDKILASETINEINSVNRNLYEQTGNKSEIFVVVEKGAGSKSGLEKKAGELFKKYKVNENSLLFIVTVPESPASPNFFEKLGDSIGEFFDGLFGGGRIAYAYSIGRDIKRDFDADKINGVFKDNFEDNYASGDYDAAVLDTFNALVNLFEQRYNLTPGVHNTDVPEESVTNAKINAPAVVGVIVLFMILVLLFGYFSGKSGQGASKVYKSKFWFGS